MQKTEPLVGGEPARFILDIIRTFPVSVHGIRIVVRETAIGTARAALERAYEVVEREVIAELDRCSQAHEHPTLSPEEFRRFVLREMFCEAKHLLGESHVIDSLWDY